MPFDSVGNFGSNEVILFIKIIILVFLAVYAIFTFVILTQVKVMNRIFTEIFTSTVLFYLALGNLIAALSLFLGAFVIL